MFEPTERFSGRADVYERHRPDYPRFVLELLERRCGFSRTSVVADVGCGTGKLARLWVENGNFVYGVEPNQDMWQTAHALLGSRPNFLAVHARAEETALPPASVDFVTVGQAFHWFDRLPAMAEFARILRPPGWLVVVRNTRHKQGDAFMRDYEAFMWKHGKEYGSISHRFAECEAFLFEAGFTLESVENPQIVDKEGLKGRLLSASVVPMPGQAGHEEMLADLDALFATHAREGQVTLLHDTNVYWGRLH